MNHFNIEGLRTLMRTKPRKGQKDTRPFCWHCKEHLAQDVHHLNSVHHDNRPENLEPWCKRCHNEHHGISDNLTELTIMARTWDKIQRDRIATGNAIDAYERLRYDVPRVHEVHAQLDKLEKDTMKAMEKMLREEPVYSLYLSKIKGVGPSISAALVSEIGDPGRFATVSALWSYCGLAVNENGEAQKRRKGQKANWNQKLRMFLCGRMADSFIKQRSGTTARRLYEQYKRFYVQRDGDTLSKGHVNNRARRKLVKVFVACLWSAWRQIKGLPVTEPYAAKLGGHTHFITPEDWAGEGWMKS
jgi:hypothetical protein